MTRVIKIKDNDYNKLRLSNISDMLNERIGKLVDFNKTINKIVEARQNLLNLPTPSISQGFSNLIKNNLKDTTQKIKKGFIETEKDLRIFKVAIVELGYPPHKGMDLPTMRHIVKLYELDKKSLENTFDSFMCSYYDNSLIMKISKQWEYIESINERLPILRNIIMAHNQGMYNVSIPSIITQFEGSIMQAFKYKGKGHGGIIKTFLDCLLEDKDSGWSFDNQINKYYKENVLIRFLHGNEIESSISRHAILHGGDITYGTQANSIKLILLFDFISNKIKTLDENTIKKGNEEVKEMLKTNSNKDVKNR